VAVPRSQLRLTEAELDDYLASQRTLRLATVDDDGVPHVVPLWFVWHAGAIWLNSLARSRRHRHLRDGRPVGLVVDDGDRYEELRGVRITGVPEVVPDDDPVRTAAMEMFGMKYFGKTALPNQRSYESVRIVPDDLASWDFRKIPAGADRKVGLAED
jgi:nitroimidazol reductase NimA-like FMN-containing flavoprotein (pyridoxamine 5'-phosphate oxidase superfamily)